MARLIFKLISRLMEVTFDDTIPGTIQCCNDTRQSAFQHLKQLQQIESSIDYEMSTELKPEVLCIDSEEENTPKITEAQNTPPAKSSPTTTSPDDDALTEMSAQLGSDGLCITPVDENTLDDIHENTVRNNEATTALDLSSPTNLPTRYTLFRHNIHAINHLVRLSPGDQATLDDLESATASKPPLLGFLPEIGVIPGSCTQIKHNGLRLNPVGQDTLKTIEMITALDQCPTDVQEHGDILSWSPSSIYSASPVSESHHFPPVTSSSPTSRPTTADQTNPSAPPPTPNTPGSPQTATTAVQDHPSCLRIRHPAFLTDFFNEMSSSEESYPASAREQEEIQQREENYAWVNSKVDEIKEAFSSQFVVLETLLQQQVMSSDSAVESVLAKMKNIEEDNLQRDSSVLQTILDVCCRIQQDLPDLPDRLMAGAQQVLINVDELAGEVLTVKEKVEKSHMEIKSSISALDDKLDRVINQLDLMAETDKRKSRRIGSLRSRKVRFARRRSVSAPPNLVGELNVATPQRIKSAFGISKVGLEAEMGANGGTVVRLEDFPAFPRIGKQKLGGEL
ncbi:hypothetical protein VTL71DRAFT_12031 [Oculimacula yallundae]|uniref:Uncharacterized protein n=1 Tax=Oculimacula yallundae TaxID=86028 RepID=A0ABR4CSF3_9HELO